MKIKGIQRGDVVEIPLPDGRYAYGQYLGMDEHNENGPLLRVFDAVSDAPLPVSQLQHKGNLFPPVYVGIGYALKTKRWKVIGALPATDEPLLFRATLGDRPGTYHDWRVIYPDRSEYIGTLPEALKDLEILQVWSPQLLEDRIVHGRSPYMERY